MGRGEQAEIPGLIPTHPKRSPIGSILVHQRDARFCDTLLYHRPASKNQAIQGPVAKDADRPVYDRLGVGRTPATLPRSRQPGAREIVNMGGRVRQVQLRSASKRRYAGATRLLGEAQNPENQCQIREG